MNTQEQFEALYADYTQTPIEEIVAARLDPISYKLPAISKAYRWFTFGRISKAIEIMDKEQENK